MAQLAVDIQSRRFEAGVWLAPGAMDKHSQLAKLHPDWILRDAQGTPINAGFCGKFYYALDATHPRALDHVRDTIRAAVQVWGFRYLKLDFLHSSLVAPAKRFNPLLTRAEVFAGFMDTIRGAAGPSVFILGCGLPVGPGVGQVQAARVSADAGPQWLPNLNDKHNIPGARNMMRNAVTRLALHRRLWLNDPDCLLLRDTTGLTLAEVKSIASVVGVLGGPTIISDDIPALSEERRRVGACLLPIASRGPRAKALDLLEREEPSAIVRRFESKSSAFLVHHNHQNPPASASTSHSAAFEDTRGDRVAAAAAAVSGAGVDDWDVVVVLNWHWRPRGKAVTLSVEVPSSALIVASSGRRPSDGSVIAAEATGGHSGAENDEVGNYKRRDENKGTVGDSQECVNDSDGDSSSSCRPASAPRTEQLSDKGATDHEGDESACCEFHVFEFWSGRYERVKGYPTLGSVVRSYPRSSTTPSSTTPGSVPSLPVTLQLHSTSTLPPHGCLLYAVRPLIPLKPLPNNATSLSSSGVSEGWEPQFVGSDFHFSNGLEVASFKWRLRQSLNEGQIQFDKENDATEADRLNSGERTSSGISVLDIIFSVGREVTNSHVWLYLPTPAPGDSSESNRDGRSQRFPRVSGSAFDGGGNGAGTGRDAAVLVPVEEGVNSDVWQVKVAFGSEGGALRVEW